MSADRNFEVPLTWEVEDGVSLPLRVFGVLTGYVAETPATFNDPGDPAEGGELEDLRIFSGARLDQALEEKLSDDERFREAVYRAIMREAVV